MIETALLLMANVTLTLCLLYVAIGVLTSCLSLMCVILMQVIEPEKFRKWEDGKPIKNLHYIPQVIIYGLFFWPFILYYSFKKREK